MLFKIEIPTPEKQKPKRIKKCENTRFKICFYNSKSGTLHATFMHKNRVDAEKELKEWRKYIKTLHHSEEKPNATCRAWVLI